MQPAGDKRSIELRRICTTGFALVANTHIDVQPQFVFFANIGDFVNRIESAEYGRTGGTVDEKRDITFRFMRQNGFF